MKKKQLVVLSGAGISAESGLNTFRDAGGLWEGHDVMEVASIDGWHRNQALVLEFYNARRKALQTVEPNKAHKILVELEQYFEVSIITQNVDDLHERAGSSRVIHLHGELLKARSSLHEDMVYDWPGDITASDKCPDGSQIRPHIVWFGEPVPMFEKAALIASQADILVIIGTSLVVYPAAGLVRYAPPSADLYVIDPQTPVLYGSGHVTFIKEKATIGAEKLMQILTEK